MREIKFRTCHNVTKVIEYITLRELADGDRFQFDYETYDWMQYTGLNDKNGKEIYEGDIVAGYTRPSKVKMMEIDAEERGKVYGWNIDVDTLDKTEVIGNIYENPELLNA